MLPASFVWIVYGAATTIHTTVIVFVTAFITVAVVQDADAVVMMGNNLGNLVWMGFV